MFMYVCVYVCARMYAHKHVRGNAYIINVFLYVCITNVYYVIHTCIHV